jgi:hypothetical protein
VPCAGSGASPFGARCGGLESRACADIVRGWAGGDRGCERTRLVGDASGLVPRERALVQWAERLGAGAFRECLADRAARSIARPCGAVLASVIDDLEVELVPRVSREQPFQVAFRLCDIARGTEFPSFGEPMDMRVHGESRDMEGLGHDNGGGLVTDAREGFEFGETVWDLSIVTFNELV